MILLRRSLSLLLVWLTACSAQAVEQQFSDAFVDRTYSCPASTTCRQVCVANTTDCPATLACPDGLTLCKDGTCEAACETTLASPCEFECASKACRNIVLEYDECQSDFATEYDYEATCGADETAAALYGFNEPAFIFLYVWLIVVTILILAYCLYNQKISPVEGSTMPLEDAEDASGMSKTQTGYRRSLLGSGVYLLTCLTLLGFHILLATTTILYYVQQEAITKFRTIFQDEEQVLKAFQITWMVGFVWTFYLKWPHSIFSLFLRRCRLNDASHIAIFVPDAQPATVLEGKGASRSSQYVTCLRRILASLFHVINGVFGLLFSDTTRTNMPGKFKYCRVQVDHDGSKYYYFNFRRYNFHAATSGFEAGVYHVASTIADLDAGRTGLQSDDVTKRRRIVGPNSIRMRKPNAMRTVFSEFSKPFYTYQCFMVWSWFPLWYYYMAVVQAIVISTGGLIVSYFRYRNDMSLYQLTYIAGEATVVRDGELTTIPQKELVPGDVVVIEPGVTYCDMVLVESAGVLVDESALTGESTPMAKTAIDVADGNKTYDAIAHKKHTISAGTTILESETADNLAVVTNTGSFTTKGELLRSILSYERRPFKFDTEVRLVIIILFFYAIFGFAMVIFFIQDTAVFGWFYGIYVVGTVLPPLLPTVFTVSVGVSEARLASRRIACTNNGAILVAGKVTMAFFDKTGTLTNQGLDFLSARSSKSWSSKTQKISDDMACGMAVCHGLSKTKNGILVGNPVDRTMFDASGAFFSTKNGVVALTGDFGTVEIIKRFDFDHHRMTQSVIVKSDDGLFFAYVKGGGESIAKICKPESLPSDFDDDLRGSAKSGTYQISMATKVVSAETDLSQVSRDEIECDLDFVGVINFKNVLREETPATIRELHEGKVSMCMITGDNVLTGIRIARESGMVQDCKKVLLGTKVHDSGSGSITWLDELDNEVRLPALDSLEEGNYDLALTGETWNALRTTAPRDAVNLADYIRVVGRCTPFDKVSIITSFIDLGRVVAMVGDGGNDCGALKTAHVGIALSDAEASIVSPFTSLDKSIHSVVEVLREGRCALASAFASYKYMIMYGQVETINQMINAYFQVTFTEWCWVFMDGVWTITLAFSLPLAKAAKKLSSTRPTASLLGPATMLSACGVLVIHFSFTVIALATLWHQDWYQCRKWDSTDVSNVLVIGDNYEAETLFLVTGYQYVSSAIVFNFGYEWRQAWIRNYIFVALVTGYTIIQFYITLVPGKLSCIWRVNCEIENASRSVTTLEVFQIQNPFHTTVMPEDYRRKLVAIMVLNTIAVIVWDYVVVNGVRQRLASSKTKKQGVKSVKDVGVESSRHVEEGERTA